MDSMIPIDELEWAVFTLLCICRERGDKRLKSLHYQQENVQTDVLLPSTLDWHVYCELAEEIQKLSMKSCQKNGCLLQVKIAVEPQSFVGQMEGTLHTKYQTDAAWHYIG